MTARTPEGSAGTGGVVSEDAFGQSGYALTRSDSTVCMAKKLSSRPSQAPVKPVTRFRHKIPLHTSRFRFADRFSLLGKARFFPDRIELSAWSLCGRLARTLALVRIVHFEYHPLEEGSNITVYLDSGEVVRLYVDEAHLWRETFENWLSYHVLASAKVMDGYEKACSMAG